MREKYKQQEQSSNSFDDEKRLKLSPYTEIEGDGERAFGVDSNFGQSLGFTLENTELIDGTLYIDSESGKYKTFSWKDVTGLSVSEHLERGDEPHAEDAPEVETKSYFGNDRTYELVAARIPEVTSPDGDEVLEASSVHRDVVFIDDEGIVERGDFEDAGGAPIGIGDVTQWFNGNEEFGPSTSSKRLAKVLTRDGNNATVDEDDLDNWLRDTTGDNVLRDDLQDRRLSFFIVQKESENGYTYNQPVVEDVKTGSTVQVDNRENESDDVENAREQDEASRSYPEPVADYIQSGKNLQLNEQRAEDLLDELLSDDDNAMTEELIEESGGRETVIQQVV